MNPRPQMVEVKWLAARCIAALPFIIRAAGQISSVLYDDRAIVIGLTMGRFHQAALNPTWSLVRLTLRQRLKRDIAIKVVARGVLIIVPRQISYKTNKAATAALRAT